MSNQLIESIVSGNMLEASNVVEKKLEEIRQQKMYEMKRMYAAKLDEALGPWQPGGDPNKLRAKGYKKAAPELERRADAAEKAKKKADKWVARFKALADTQPSAEGEPENKKKEGWVRKVARNVVSGDIISHLRDVGTSNLE